MFENKNIKCFDYYREFQILNNTVKVLLVKLPKCSPPWLGTVGGKENVKSISSKTAISAISDSF